MRLDDHWQIKNIQFKQLTKFTAVRELGQLFRTSHSIILFFIHLQWKYEGAEEKILVD